MSTAAELRDAGLALCRQKDFAGGEAKLRDALAVAPGDPDTLEALIKVRGIQKDYDGAKQYLVDAMKADPTQAKPRHTYGLLMYNAGRYDEAKDVFRQLIEMNQRDGEAHFQLANVYRKENNVNEAAKHYNLAIDAVPAHAAAFNNLGMLQMSQDMASESVPHFKQAIALDPKNVNYRMNFAKALEACQRYREAATNWEELLTLNLSPEQQDEAITRLAVCKEK